MLCKNICFYCRGKKNEACQSPECNQEALCHNRWYDSNFLLLPSCSEADEKEMQKNFLKTPTHPLTGKHVTPTDSFGKAHSLGERGGSSLVFGAERLPNHQLNGECKGSKVTGPESLGKSTLHNANCTSAAITFLF